MNAINLNCLTFGDPVDRIFPVKVARTETVGELRKLIKKEKDPLFNNIPADELLLWLVSLPANDTALKNLSLENKLNPVDEIGEIVGDTSLNKKHVHIIVQLPKYYVPPSAMTPSTLSPSSIEGICV
ncbi:hypothetical protein BC936DRAFT_142882 [Jimgerdemannia flammicorona]|uniref:Crinkler effector protein N-terminal domain-containing protein n=1 Tax=Jimgerdemannia flammicorona TaxID=994334 RepID=A0A433A062_9FUNG|nr:hypothetical protein BC936DRAFT_142882 [Jimgerdemannia flammicorona]